MVNKVSQDHKVLHLVASGGLYGAETVVLNLSKELKDSEFHPIVGLIFQKNKGFPELGIAAKELDIETVFFPIRFKFDPAGCFLVRKYLIDQDIDIVHSHGYKATLLASLATFSLKIPVMVTCHLWANRGDLKLKFYHEMEARIMRLLPAVVGVSEEICNILVKKGVNAKKVELIHNGIELSNYRKYSKQDTFSMMNEFNIHDGDFVIGTAGRFNLQKAHSYLLDALKILKDRNIDVKCLIVGEGPLRKSLEEQRDQLDLVNMVHLPGFRPDALNIIEQMDVFVMSSVDEGLPMVLLEAMALKKPIITTPVGAIKDVIINNYNGLLYEIGDVQSLADHISILKEDSAKRKNLGEKSYRTFKNEYTSEIMAKKYIDLYHSLL